MKKVICVILVAILLCVSLCACNMSVGIGNYSFKHVHFAVDNEGHCADVASWHDNELGCEVNTEQYGSLYLSEGSYIMIESADTCPYCGG